VRLGKKDDNQTSVIRLAEFTDTELEKEYFNNEIKNAKRYIKPILLVLGILNFLFIIPDYFFLDNSNGLAVAFVNRLVFLMLVVILYLRLKHIKNYRILICWFTLYEILASVSFLMILYMYPSPNFLIQSFGVMIIILAIFLIPNRWIYMVFVSVAVSISFFALSAYYLKDIELSELSASVVYLIIVIILSGISSYRVNYFKRIQFIYNKKLVEMSTYDPLTGILNRFKLDEELRYWISYSKRYKIPMSLVIFDFDDFKKVNDSYGHLEGDKVLIEAVKLIKNNIRNTDVFARWGGDEFFILLPNTEKQLALELTERLRTVVAGHRFDNIGNITCSFGVASFKEHDDFSSLLHRADKMLYMAKHAGKNTVAGD
jgi:two-component system cell cycle response regulator